MTDLNIARFTSVNTWIYIANGHASEIIDEILAAKSHFRFKTCYDCIEIIKQVVAIPRWKEMIRLAFADEKILLIY